MAARNLDSSWMWLLGLTVAAVLGGAVLDIEAAAIRSVARAGADAPSGARADGRAVRADAMACPI
ncbi:MAG: hypothetical protein OHK0044_14790 [Burkholderiaceae bacterium]